MGHVEKRRDRCQQPVGALEHPNVRCAWQEGHLGSGKPHKVAQYTRPRGGTAQPRARSDCSTKSQLLETALSMSFMGS